MRALAEQFLFVAVGGVRISVQAGCGVDRRAFFPAYVSGARNECFHQV